MKAQKIGIAGISLLMLTAFTLPCVAQNASEEKNTEIGQEKNTEAAPQQNQGEDQQQQIQNQATEQIEASQNSDAGNDDNGKNENETGAKQTLGEDSGNDSENGQKVQNQGDQRRIRVANATQEMLGVAERNPDIGQQIRTVAQNQDQDQEEMEGALQNAQKRSGVVKFFIGPNYKELKRVEDHLENHNNRLEEIKGLRAQLENSVDAEVLTQQIQIMEQIGAELENEVNEEKKGVSLFGWLFKWFS